MIDSQVRSWRDQWETEAAVVRVWGRALRIQSVSASSDKTKAHWEDEVVGNSGSSECLLSVSSIKEIRSLQFIKEKENNSNLDVLSAAAPGLFTRAASCSVCLLITSSNTLTHLSSTRYSIVAIQSWTCQPSSWINKWRWNRVNGWFRHYVWQCVLPLLPDRCRGSRSTISRIAATRLTGRVGRWLMVGGETKIRRHPRPFRRLIWQGKTRVSQKCQTHCLRRGKVTRALLRGGKAALLLIQN